MAIKQLLTAGDGLVIQRPPSSTDHDHIALLKQYNDLRDVTQQFIGLIAENQGVPIRSLYADGGFGVDTGD